MGISLYKGLTNIPQKNRFRNPRLDPVIKNLPLVVRNPIPSEYNS